jgi:hypothetical protein
MVHTTRKSYKEKYESLRQASGRPNRDVDELARNLAEFGEFQAVAEGKRAEQYDLLQDLAREITELVIMLDARDGQLGLSFKDTRVPIDANLVSMDGNLIVRRARDVVKKATDRVGIAGCRVDELQNQLNNLKVGASLLKPVAEKARRGFFESYIVGNSPTEAEMTDIDMIPGKNPRSMSYDYRTDEESSDSEVEENNSTAVALSSPRSFAKPSGRTAASRRTSQEKSSYVDIS